MSRTISIGRLFLTTTLQAQGAPLVDRGVTHGQRQGPATFEDGTPVTPSQLVARSHHDLLRKIVVPQPVKLVGDCRVIRPPFTGHRPVRALVVGIWRKPPVQRASDLWATLVMTRRTTGIPPSQFEGGKSFVNKEQQR